MKPVYSHKPQKGQRVIGYNAETDCYYIGECVDHKMDTVGIKTDVITVNTLGNARRKVEYVTHWESYEYPVDKEGLSIKRQ